MTTRSPRPSSDISLKKKSAFVNVLGVCEVFCRMTYLTPCHSSLSLSKHIIFGFNLFNTIRVQMPEKVTLVHVFFIFLFL